MSSSFGRRAVTFVEIVQPLCTRIWGDAFSSPPAGSCDAVLGVDALRKCHNTFATCPVQDVYNAGELVLRFSMSDQPGLFGYGYCLPMLLGVESNPQSINLGGMDPGAQPFGVRESVTIAMRDGKHSDLLVDPYRAERITGAASAESPPDAYDPSERGTFWGKWLARNPYYNNYVLRVRQGFEGDDLEDMRVRHYIIDRIDGPSKGSVKIVAKDRFSQLESDKAVAPAASQGELSANISASATSFTVEPAGIGSTYLAAGHVCIGDEVIQYTRSGDTFTVVARGALSTDAAEHDDEDLVQQVLAFVSMRAHDIVYELICGYTALGNAGSPTGSSYIDKAEWDAAAAQLTGLYTARIARPTPVRELIGELMEQVGFTVWHDVEAEQIRFKAVRAAASVVAIDEPRHVVADSMAEPKRRTDKRASQVWVYYGQRSPVDEVDNAQNFLSRYVDPDLEAEGDNKYGVAKIRPVFSRWIPQFGRSLAVSASERLLAQFVDPPTELEFSLHNDIADGIDLGDFVTVQAKDVQDATGQVDGDIQYAVVEVERGERESRFKVQSIIVPDLEDARTISIENDDYNLNLRTIHDTIFAAPVGGSPTGELITFIVDSGVTIGSTSTGSYALRTGTWPAGVQLVLVNRGRIEGKGGAGGAGADAVTFDGAAGAAGGPAFLAEHAITIDNGGGQIWGGGGGGGGGGFGNGPDIALLGGGGGGGGAGEQGGAGGAGGATHEQTSGAAGNPGTQTGGGTGGAGGTWSGANGGAGGNGGGPGLAGSSGGSGTAGGSGGGGGAAGAATGGSSLITWASPSGDIRGAMA